MAHLRLSGTATELMVVDLSVVKERPNSRIVLVDIVSGSPTFNMVISDSEGRRRWKVVGVGMTPPPMGARMVLTLDAVEGDGRILPGDRLMSAEAGDEDGNGNGDSAILRPPPIS